MNNLQFVLAKAIGLWLNSCKGIFCIEGLCYLFSKFWITMLKKEEQHGVKLVRKVL